MNPQSFEEAQSLFNATKKIATKYTEVDLIVAPPVVFLRDLAKGYRGERVEFSAQNIFWEHAGSYTGEVSAAQARDAGATYVIIGHAERRAIGVTNEQIANKVQEAFHDKLEPIIAVGEHERDAHGEYVREVRQQITGALDDIPAAKFKNITIAYEPVWAIGAPEAPGAHEVHQMMLLVRKTLADAYGDKAMRSVRVVYGGSVNNENAHEIFAVPDLDGVLVGRASLDPFQLESIVSAANKA